MSHNPQIPSSNLPVVLQDTDLVLSKANMLMDVANKILSEKSTIQASEANLSICLSYEISNRLISFIHFLFMFDQINLRKIVSNK